MEAKKKPISVITIVKPTFIVGKEAKPGDRRTVPAQITDSDARVLIAQGMAIEGDGNGAAAEFVERAVEKHKAAVATRAAQREKLKPVSNREIFEKLLETQQLLVSLLGKMSDLMFVEPEPTKVESGGGGAPVPDPSGDKDAKPGKPGK